MRFFAAALAVICLSAPSLYAADHGVVLLYHHVSNDTPASTSVSPEVFRQHLEYLDANHFKILPLSHILKNLQSGSSLSDKTVSITFDDAYRSILDQAIPLLQDRNWPYTIFVNTLAVDRGYSNYLSWNELRELREAGAEIGNHSQGHAHLVRRLQGETEAQWRTRITEDIQAAGKRLQKEVGGDNNLFAYPYGEHTPELQQIVGELGYFGIAQQSGAVGTGSNMLAVPRFPMATNYSDINRFSVSVYARPLPVKDVSSGPVVQVQSATDQYQLRFVLLPEDYRKTGLACYSSSGEKLTVRLEKNSGEDHVSMQLPAWKAGRRKINCTAPSLSENGVYFWFSHLWLVKMPDGAWYDE